MLGSPKAAYPAWNPYQHEKLARDAESLLANPPISWEGRIESK